MAFSSILGADVAPAQPSGRDADLLGPSDNSDSGSDAIGTSEAHEDSDAAGTGSRGVVAGSDAREGGDILPDRIVNLSADGSFTDAEPEDREFTDLDNEDVADEDGDAGDKR